MKSGNDDEFDIKLDNYIDAKMKTNKSEDIYPLLDKTLRRKRISENKYININHENKNSPVNLENKTAARIVK